MKRLGYIGNGEILLHVAHRLLGLLGDMYYSRTKSRASEKDILALFACLHTQEVQLGNIQKNME